MDMGRKSVKFLVEIHATYSVLNTASGILGHKSRKIMWVLRKAQEQAFIKPLECKFDEHTLTHSFLYASECPIPLLGREILHKLGATIHLMEDKLETVVPLNKGYKMIMLTAS